VRPREHEKQRCGKEPGLAVAGGWVRNDSHFLTLHARARRARESAIGNGGVSGRAARRYWKPAGPCSLSVPDAILDPMAITSTPTLDQSMASPGKSISQRQSELLAQRMGNRPVRFVEDVIADQPELEERLSSESSVIGHGFSSTRSTQAPPNDSDQDSPKK
jgi:hypothetical protein